VKLVDAVSLLAAMACFFASGLAFAGNEPSYTDTVRLIRTTMASGTSDIRQESYDYIRFNACRLDYRVAGSYRAGGPYDMKFSNIDFSSLNSAVSKVGHDYTAFVLLNFKKPALVQIDTDPIPVHTVVVNVSNDATAELLFTTFLHLGELCGAQQSISP
jgi:hypothetical protein